jgi:hypothetical protein
MAYFGRSSSVPAWFHDPAWHKALAAIGVTFEIRDARWFDYSDVDVVLAHRVEAATMLRQKPASKLTNAWRAGVPALLATSPRMQRSGRATSTTSRSIRRSTFWLRWSAFARCPRTMRRWRPIAGPAVHRFRSRPSRLNECDSCSSV